MSLSPRVRNNNAHAASESRQTYNTSQPRKEVSVARMTSAHPQKSPPMSLSGTDLPEPEAVIAALSSAGDPTVLHEMLNAASELADGVEFDTEKRIQCEHCPSTFKRQAELNRHSRKHEGVRPFVCEHCSAAFTERTVLITHLRRHTGERPFACSHCSRKFTQRAACVRHERIHAGERPFRFAARSWVVFLVHGSLPQLRVVSCDVLAEEPP
jgi:uncharacterized Zn-finger protein